MNEQEKQIKELIAKAASSHDSNDALKFSQAAANAANALCAIVGARQPLK